MIPLLAEIMFQGMSLGNIIVAIIIIAAVIAVLFVALRVFDVKIPDWVLQILWICVVAVVAIFAVRFLLSL